MKTYESGFIKLNDIKAYEMNSRVHTQEQILQIKESIKAFGFTNPVLINSYDNLLIAGHARVEAVKALNRLEFKDNPIKDIPCIFLKGLSENDYRALVIADNKLALNASWDIELLQYEILQLERDNYNMELLGFDDLELKEITDYKLGDFSKDDNVKEGGDEVKKYEDAVEGSLIDKYLEPPFSVIKTYSQRAIDRCQFWKSKGIIEGGRDELYNNKQCDMNRLNILTSKLKGNDAWSSDYSASIFNPYLCEVLHKWFNLKKNAKVIDPFAGGMVRAFIANALGHSYLGFEVRLEQIEFNDKALKKAKGGFKLDYKYIEDTSENMDLYFKDESFDFCLTCPPYAYLEQYSDLDKDISNKSYEDFLKAYENIISKLYKVMKNNTFVAWVISEVRNNKGKNGEFINLVGDTISAFIKAGFKYYNEIILLNSTVSSALRAGIIFKYRKVVRCHQNILIFYKGDNVKDILKDIEYNKDDDKEIYDDINSEDNLDNGEAS